MTIISDPAHFIQSDFIDMHCVIYSILTFPLDKKVIEIIHRVEKGENVRHQQYFESIGRWFDRSFYSLKRGQLVTLSIDITQQKLAEKELRESQAALEKTHASLERKVMERTHELTEALAREKELSELKSRFMSIASHEFRTPIARRRHYICKQAKRRHRFYRFFP